MDWDKPFQSGFWESCYFQYGKWRGPYAFLVFFDDQQLKITGSGSDDVGEFTMDGIYSLGTCRICLTKIYKEGTGDPSQNLGHTVIIQLEWNSEERQFDGHWYVKTNKYNGKDRFELKFDRPAT